MDQMDLYSLSTSTSLTFTVNRIARIWLGLSIHAEQPVGQYDVVLHSHTKEEKVGK
jgi:hypothetical protein